MILTPHELDVPKLVATDVSATALGGNDHGGFRSHFGVQVFEKQSGRPDLNRRPLDPQESIHIPATRSSPCFRR